MILGLQGKDFRCLPQTPQYSCILSALQEWLSKPAIQRVSFLIAMVIWQYQRVEHSHLNLKGDVVLCCPGELPVVHANAYSNLMAAAILPSFRSRSMAVW